MTDEQLEGIAAQALNLAKFDMERGVFKFFLGVWNEGEGLHRMRKVETLIVEILGRDWLNDAHKKDMGFDVIRQATNHMPPDAVIFVCAANMFRGTDKLRKLPKKERARRFAMGHDEHHKMAAEGLLEMTDCLMALAQTATRVCHRMQAVRGFNPLETRFFNQSEFDGRTKFYGEPGKISEALKADGAG